MCFFIWKHRCCLSAQVARRDCRKERILPFVANFVLILCLSRIFPELKSGDLKTSRALFETLPGLDSQKNEKVQELLVGCASCRLWMQQNHVVSKGRLFQDRLCCNYLTATCDNRFSACSLQHSLKEVSASCVSRLEICERCQSCAKLAVKTWQLAVDPLRWMPLDAFGATGGPASRASQRTP